MIETRDRVRYQGSDSKKFVDNTYADPLFITNSSEMNELLGRVKKFAMSEASILITGESGVGKEVIARLIHSYSPRRNKPFIPINSCAIPEELFESELFGHEKGAFTGATSAKEGFFEQAEGGTLFLDEIGDMPASLQVKVLRAIEMKSFRRVGGKREVSVDVRIVSATNQILLEKVEDKSFREDLYHRLNVLELYIPPLRRRTNDIPVLVDHFLKFFKEKYNCPDVEFSDGCMEVFKEYMWPGNVRELRNILERCVITGSSKEIEPSVLPRHFLKDRQFLQQVEKKEFYQVPMGSTMHEIEQAVILQTLATVDNNKSEAARILGLTRKTLTSKIAR